MNVELTPHTLSVFKNFSAINSNLILTPGNVIKTVSKSNNVAAEAIVSENFPVEFGIYDLPSFIGVLSSFESPVLTFSDEVTNDGSAKYVTISEKDSGETDTGQFKFFGAPKNHLHYAEVDLSITDAEINFHLSKDVLAKCLKAAAMSSLPNLVLQSSGVDLDLVVRDEEQASSNEFRIKVSKQGNGNNLNIIFDVNVIRMLPGSYDVCLDEDYYLCQFTNDEKGLKYFITSERTSTHG